jgi:hypothetical protein
MGQKFAAFNETGTIIAFYDSVDSPLPVGVGANAIPITDQQWQMCLASPGGFIVVNKMLTASTIPVQTPKAPTLTQQAKSLLANGVSVISNSVSAISSTYAIDTISMSKAMNTAMYVQMNNKFPGNQTTLPWQDAGNNTVVFPTTVSFLNFVNGLSDYVSALDAVMLGTSTTLPKNPITID